MRAFRPGSCEMCSPRLRPTAKHLPVLAWGSHTYWRRLQQHEVRLRLVIDRYGSGFWTETSRLGRIPSAEQLCEPDDVVMCGSLIWLIQTISGSSSSTHMSSAQRSFSASASNSSIVSGARVELQMLNSRTRSSAQRQHQVPRRTVAATPAKSRHILSCSPRQTPRSRTNPGTNPRRKWPCASGNGFEHMCFVGTQTLDSSGKERTCTRISQS
jgi:hypothetical protein